MATRTPPSTSPHLSRSDVELELARLALALMRASPHAFAPFAVSGAVEPSQMSVIEFQTVASRLLARTSEDQREFVSGRLQELAHSCAGLHFEGFDDWLGTSFAPHARARLRDPQVPQRDARPPLR